MPFSRVKKVADWMVTTASVMLVGATGYYVIFEPPYLTYKNLPFPPLVTDVKAGDIAPLLVQRCNSTHKAQTYTIARSLEAMENRRFIVLPEVTVRIESGCTESVSLVNAIPRETPPGRYRIIGLAEIQGTVRTQHVPWYSGEFRVVAP